MGYDIQVYGETVETYNEIAKLDNVDEYSYSFITEASLDINKYGSEFGKRMAGDDANEENRITIVLLNNEYFKRFVEKLGVQSTNYKDIAILEDDTYEYIDERAIFQSYYNLKSGDVIDINLTNGEKKSVKITKTKQSLLIGLLADLACVIISIIIVNII